MECPACHASLPDEALFCLRCGTKAPVATTREPDDPIRATLRRALGEQYEIQRLLGRGGMGAVYLATEAALEREVAIKVLPPDRGATKESRDRFRREARTAAKLSHPNIVPLYTFGDVEGTLYFVMGYVKGESLATRLKREGRLEIEDARRILIEIAEALDYAHRLGIVHRDIKPDNVLIEEDSGRAMLMDFGVAKALGAGQTVTEAGSVLGTPHYMSPEQAQGKADIDARSDLYSLGVMGYAMLAGRLPFEGPTPGDVMVQHITKEAPALRTVAPEIPPEIATSLMRCLEKDPAKRWADAKSLRESVVPRDDREIPDDMVGLRRDVQLTILGLYASAVIAFRATTLIPDPEAFEVPWDGVYMVTAFLGLSVLNSIRLRHREGRTGREILAFALSKPDWWVGWYPARLRLRGDVWPRLPRDLRRTRAALWGFLLLYALWVPPQFVYFSGLDAYVKKGIKNPAQLFFERAPRAVRGTLMPASFGLTMLGLMGSGLLSAVRWGRSTEVRRRSRHMANAMFIRDTAHRTFWEKPEVASLLLPENAKAGRGALAPSSPRELVSAILTAAESLSGGVTTTGARAREAAQRIQTVLGQLDAEITSLSNGSDPAEADRLAAKIAALGPPLVGEGDAKAQMRDLLEKQLALLRGVESRLEGLRARRGRQLDLLRALWQQAQALASAGSDPSRASVATERIHALCEEISDHADASSSTRDLDLAITESPTLER